MSPVSGGSAAENSEHGATNRFPSWIGAIPIGIAFVLLMWMSWRKWPDVLVDFGRQLYVPWRLSEGSVLYEDVAYIFGCLSSCWHALLFKVFGVSLNVLLVSNVLIILLLLALVYRCFLKAADLLAATSAGLLVVILATGQFLDVGNYNYLCPYSHEALHGLVLAIVMTTALSRWLESCRNCCLAIGVFCYGLTLLTKPEIFLATTAVAAFALIFSVGADVRRRNPVSNSPSRCLVGYSLAVVCALLPLAAFFFYFNSVTDSREALRALFRAWEPVFNSDSVGIPFYQAGAGLDTPWFHISRMAIEFGVLALITVICGWRLGRPTLTSIERIVLFVAVGAAGINYDWHRAGHSLPVLILCAAVLLWFESRSSPGERIRREATLSPTGGEGRGEGALGYMEKPQLIFPALWLVLSLFLMAKMGLNTRIEHYGVFLTMPACLSVVYLLLHLVPRFIERRGFVSRYFRIAMLILLLTGFARLIIQSALFYRDKDLPLGPPGDRIVTYNPGVDPTGAAMAAAVDWIETNTAPTNTLAVLPEGVMLNYLTRRSNPTPHVVFLLEVSIYGEHTMLEAFRKTPPDYIVLVHRESTEFGASYFGLQEGHGLEIMQWVNQNYETVHLIGSEPLKTKDFGIKILRKSPGRLATTSK